MIGGDAIGFHAIAEFLDTAPTPITYEPVSSDTGDFNSLNFKTRDDYIQPSAGSDILWDDNTNILWDNDTNILFDE